MSWKFIETNSPEDCKDLHANIDSEQQDYGENCLQINT
jgi:hypothetical protein